MSRRIISVTIAVAAILSLALIFTGCQNNSALAEYKAAFAKTDALTEFHTKLTADISIESGRASVDPPLLSMNLPISLEMKIKLSDDLKSVEEMWMVSETDLFGQSLSHTAYFKDGIMYQESNGTKVKVELPMDQVMEEANSVNADLPLTAEMLTDAVRTEKDGVVTVKLSIDGNALAKQLLEMLPQNTVGDVADSENLEFSSTEIEYQINKDGYLSMLKIYYVAAATSLEDDDEYRSSLTVDMKIEFLNAGSPITIDYPDFSDYLFPYES